MNEVSAKQTSQTCSSCGYIREGDNKLTLNDKVYICPICGLELKRDINAAINIRSKGIKGYGVKEFKFDIIGEYRELKKCIENYNKSNYKYYSIINRDTRPGALANESFSRGGRKNSCIHHIWSKT